MKSQYLQIIIKSTFAGVMVMIQLKNGQTEKRLWIQSGKKIACGNTLFFTKVQLFWLKILNFQILLH